ncbi:MAG: hypothetical protein ACRC42_02445 [Mycoplasma sp.]
MNFGKEVQEVQETVIDNYIHARGWEQYAEAHLAWRKAKLGQVEANKEEFFKVKSGLFEALVARFS